MFSVFIVSRSLPYLRFIFKPQRKVLNLGLWTLNLITYGGNINDFLLKVKKMKNKLLGVWKLICALSISVEHIIFSENLYFFFVC